jgi:squalene-hopene/tetraprenyl-beta-curcumene cyclase
MLSRQNPDGGWGETPAALEDPGFAGYGPSSVQITGIVTWALLLAGLRADSRLAAAVRYLVEQQRPDGSWEDRACFGTIFPLVHHYHTDTFPTYFALEALLAYER